MRASVITVLEPVEPGELGFCQAHEHLCIEAGYIAELNPALLIDEPSSTAVDLEIYRIAGGRALVDAQPPGCGHNARVMAELSRKTEIHVIASTEFHLMRFYPREHWIHEKTVSELTALFCGELPK